MRFRSPRSLLTALLATLAAGMTPSLAQAQQWPRMVRDLHSESSNPRVLTAFQGSLYFLADSWMGAGLFRTDGTEAGTVLVWPFDASATTEIVVWNGAMYLPVRDPSGDTELWRTDGTFEGTQRLTDDVYGSADPRFLTPSGKYLYFSANDPSRQKVLWRTDGTPAGTMIVAGAEIAKDPRHLTDLGGILLFVGNDGSYGDELWRTDGEPFTSIMLADINPGPAGSAISGLTAIGGQAFFSADDGATGAEPWVTNGEPWVGTRRLADIRPGPDASSPQNLTAVRRELFFTADDGTSGRALWKLDSALGQLVTVTSFPELWSSAPNNLCSVEGRLHFVAGDFFHGVEPWVMEAQDSNAAIASDIGYNEASSNPSHLTDVNGSLLFQADGPYPGSRILWSSGGLPDNTFLLGFAWDPAQMTSAGGDLYFTAHDDSNGVELWTIDNQPPVAVAGPDLTVEPGQTAFLHGYGSHDPDGAAYPLSFEWRDDDGVVLTRQPWLEVPVTTPGTREFTLIVRDGVGGRGEDNVRVGTPGRVAPAVTITSPVDAEVLHATATYDIRWTAADDDGVAAVKAFVSMDGGLTYTLIPGCDLPGTATSCTWTPPTATTRGRLKVEAYDGVGDRASHVIGFEVWGALTGPQRLDVTLRAAAPGAYGIVLIPGDACYLNPGEQQRTCTFHFPPGELVPLLARAGDPFSFEGWTGDCAGTEEECMVRMNGPRQVTATFGPPQSFDLTVTVESIENGSGIVDLFASDGSYHSCPGVPGTVQTCTFQYVSGTTVYPYPVWGGDSAFVGWSGACTGQGPCSFTMTGPQQLGARFGGPVTLTVSVVSVENGMGYVAIIGPPETPPNFCEAALNTTQTCTFQYPVGTTLTLEPTSGDSIFLGWAGACTGNGPCQVTMDGAREVTATFRGPQEFSLTVWVDSVENGMGRIDVIGPDATYTCQGVPGSTQTCTFPFPNGASVTLTATPAVGSLFLGWEGDCQGTAPCTLTMDRWRGMLVRFRGPKTLTLQVNSVDGGSGRVQLDYNQFACENTPGTSAQCAFPIPPSTTVSLTPLPKPDSVFAGWGGACSGTGQCQVTMSTAATVTAAFALANRPPVANPGGPYAGVRNQAVVFNGSGSSDPDGDPLTYAWDFGDGTSGDGVTPAHAYASLGTYTVTLVVNDGRVSSPPVSTTVTISNATPVANAGPDQTVSHPALVVLDGRASTDGDGTIVAYSWRQVAGTPVVLLGAEYPVAAFKAPQVQDPETLEFELTVTDNDGATATDRVLVTVTR